MNETPKASKKTEYMERHVGEIFEGTVSSIKSFGMYVELPNTIRGLVKIESLENDDYSYQEDRQSLIGTQHRRHIQHRLESDGKGRAG